ncbi:MAG: Uncharacterised protein [Crocinitomicaceae bacterium]|nr:MAG: Uncharacterised protein [Crocinitomicaceae bacterium]
MFPTESVSLSRARGALVQSKFPVYLVVKDIQSVKGNFLKGHLKDTLPI